MKNIELIDTTICRKDMNFTFKEKLRISRQLSRLEVSAIELPEISDVLQDILLIRTVSTFTKTCTVSCAAGSTGESIANAVIALDRAAKPRVRIELPVSPVGMEYTCHKKPAKMLEWIAYAVAEAKKSVDDVEFCAVDSTRAEADFLDSAIKAAVEAGASRVTICDNAAEMLPDDFAGFVAHICEVATVPVYVNCSDKNGLSSAECVMACRAGAAGVKGSIDGENLSLENFASLIRNCGENFGLSANIRDTEMNRVFAYIRNRNDSAEVRASADSTEPATVHLDSSDPKEAVVAAASQLGYDLDEDDQNRVYEEFLRVAQKKTVGAKELDAIVASVSMQVEPTYTLVTYSVTASNALAASAHVILDKKGTTLQGIGLGDGPVAAAFLTVEQLIGRHFDLDDFQIKSVTEGREAVGVALVKLKHDGKLYSGNGISTDIIGASIRAYLGAVNKIVCEEV